MGMWWGEGEGEMNWKSREPVGSCCTGTGSLTLCSVGTSSGEMGWKVGGDEGEGAICVHMADSLCGRSQCNIVKQLLSN